MNRIAIALVLALLNTAFVAVGNTAASQSEPPSVSPSWEYSSDGCSGWSLTDARWAYSCVAYGDTWVYQEAYFWDSDGQAPVLYWQSFFDWVDLWGWSCYVPGACEA